MEDIIASINEDAVSESSAVADTAAESVPEDGSSSDSEQVMLQDLAHERPSELQAAAEKTHRVKRPPLWDNGYFYIPDNTGNPDVKINMHQCWSHEPPGGMGLVKRSKTLTPAHYGESRADCVKSFLMLRAWMLWRVKQKGWVDYDRGRMRHFAEEGTKLQRKIAALEPRPRGKLLGHARADALLQDWVPDICARLRAT